MAGPITWRNVDGPSLGSPGQSLLGAQASFNGTFDTFQKLLAQREQLDVRNQAIGQEVGKQAFLDAVYGAKTPEELAALQQSGQLDRMQEGLGVQARSALRGADVARLNDIRQGVVANNEFANNQRVAADAPIEAKFLAQIAQGNFEGVKAALPNAGMSDFGVAKISSALAEAQRKALEMSRKDSDYARNTKVEDLRLAKMERTEKEDEQLRNLEAEVDLMVQNRLKPPDLKAAIRESMRTGKPVPDLGTGSDTEAADKAYESLVKSGKYSASMLSAQRGKIREKFATTGLKSLVGNDAAERDLAVAKEAVHFDGLDKNNWYAPGAANAASDYEAIAKSVPDLIDKTTGFGADEDVADIQSLIHRLGSVGLKTDEGYFVPSANDLRAAIRSASGGWFSDSTRAENVEKALREMAKGSVFKQKLKNGEASAKYRDNEAVKKKLRGD